MKKIIKNLKKMNKDKLITIIFLSAISIPLITLIVQLIMTQQFDGNKYLMIMVSFLVLCAFFVPAILEKKFNLNIPAPIYISFLVFLYCSATLGEVKRFFYIYAYWDDLLHFFNGLILGTLGFSVVYLFNKSNSDLKLTPFFVAFFALCFAVTCGVFWEMFEYTNDYFLATNMQKYMLENGTKFVGQLALRDTMNDLITDFVGALVPAYIGYWSLKKDYKWTKKFLITKRSQK